MLGTTPSPKTDNLTRPFVRKGCFDGLSAGSVPPWRSLPQRVKLWVSAPHFWLTCSTRNASLLAVAWGLRAACIGRLFGGPAGNTFAQTTLGRFPLCVPGWALMQG